MNLVNSISHRSAGISRRSALALTVGAAAAPLLSKAAFAEKRISYVYDLKPIKITDGVWTVFGVSEPITKENGGAIANVTILDTKDGAVIVDTGPSHRYGTALASLAEKLTGKPAARVYVTHIHSDHSLGASAFKPETLYGPPGLNADLKYRGNDITNGMYRVVGDWMRGTELPDLKQVAKDGVEEIGGRKFRCMTMVGHTKDDLCLYEETSGLLIAGDLVFLDRAPTTPDADLPAWRKSLAKLADIPHSKLIPGHGPAEPGKRGIEQTQKWIDFVDDAISKHFAEGLDVTEMMAKPIPDWTKNVAVARYEYQRSVMHLLPRFEADRLPIVSG